MQQLTSSTTLAVVPKSRKDLAAEFGNVHPNTISNWCKKIGILTRGRLNVHEVLQFYAAYGLPGVYEMRLELA